MSAPGRPPRFYETLIPRFHDDGSAILMVWLWSVWVVWRKRG